MNTKPVASSPSKLYGSFNYGFRASPSEITQDFLSRVEAEQDQTMRLWQAQHTIGALMALVALQSGYPTWEHKAAMNKLAELTGMNVCFLVGGVQ